VPPVGPIGPVGVPAFGVCCPRVPGIDVGGPWGTVVVVEPDDGVVVVAGPVVVDFEGFAVRSARVAPDAWFGSVPPSRPAALGPAGPDGAAAPTP
jgi:hypothetical protein